MMMPRNGIPVALPPNYYFPPYAQNLILSKTLSVPNGSVLAPTTVTAFTFTVPLQFNGWILSFFASSVNNQANPTAPTTFITPLNNNQRMYPFVGDPAFTPSRIFPLNNTFEMPAVIAESNIIQVNVSNIGAVQDTVSLYMAGWIGRNYTPNPEANRNG